MQFEYKGFSNNTLFLISVILMCLSKQCTLFIFLIIFKFLRCFSASTGYTGIHLDQMHFFLYSLWLQLLS